MSIITRGEKLNHNVNMSGKSIVYIQYKKDIYNNESCLKMEEDTLQSSHFLETEGVKMC